MTGCETMEEDKIATIYSYENDKIYNISYNDNTTIEDLCIKMCKTLGIGPVARYLFSLRNQMSKYWYYPGFVLNENEKYKLEFRLRWKSSNMQRLRQIDVKAYDYYFLQVRHDVLDNKVPDINYEKHKQELFGLGVTDMYRVMLEKNMSVEEVLTDYKKFIPKVCIKRHPFFIKKPIRSALNRLSGHDVAFVKQQYLKQFHNMAPNYPSEEYRAVMAKHSPTSACKVELRLNCEGINYHETDNPTDWKLLCTIEDLCYVTIRHDNVVDISRKNGIPSYLKFGSHMMILSFISVLDGYYRLTFKWTFNLCGDLATPSLESLRKLRCHGPVGGEFSYSKLKKKRDNRSGTFILRESETSYDSYYLDVCGCDKKPRTYKIDKIGPEEYRLTDSGRTFKSFRHIINEHQNSSEHLYLNECLPPSEYDKSPLLICAPEKIGSDVTADAEIVSRILDGGPRIIQPCQLQVYQGQPLAKTGSTIDLIRSTTPKTTLYRAMWRAVKGKKLEAAIKMLKDNEWKYSKDFLDMAGKWSQLRSGALVRLYGLTIAPAVGMVLELVKHGSLDMYLRNQSPDLIKTVDLVEAASCLANAVWHLQECRIVHGNIRCRKLLVYAHTDNSFIVKLADPGLFNYTLADIHWLPPECYGNMESAKYNAQADIWAVATTFWQIFSKGGSFPNYDIKSLKKFYMSGKYLPIPKGCPVDVYKLMLDCWGEPDSLRKQPQAIMRDIHRILYQVFNSRRTHAYATAFPKLLNENETAGETNLVEYTTTTTVETELESSQNSQNPRSPWDDDSFDNFSSSTLRQNGAEDDEFDDFVLSESLTNLSFQETMKCRAVDDGLFGRMQSIFELGTNCNVILKHKIGQGFYGEVYLGIMEKEDNATSPIQVAVKKLKNLGDTELRDINDFQREIDIMKNLKHINIVAILGVIYEPEISLVMEYVEHGSLQSYLSINRETLTHQKLLSFSYDIAVGMHYLEMKNIVHRDLATRNVLVTDDERVKISDFGLAQFKGENDYYILKTCREIPIKWYAPESLSQGKFSSRSDVWSFGVTMFEIFSFGEDPKLPGVDMNNKETESSEQFLEALTRGVRLPCPICCPQKVYVNIMYPCWNFSSHERPNFKELCDKLQTQMDEIQ